MTLQLEIKSARRIVATVVALSLSPSAHAFGQEAVFGMLGILAASIWVFSLIGNKVARAAKMKTRLRRHYIYLAVSIWIALAALLWFGIFQNPNDSLLLAMAMLILVAALSMGLTVIWQMIYLEIKSRRDAPNHY